MDLRFDTPLAKTGMIDAPPQMLDSASKKSGSSASPRATSPHMARIQSTMCTPITGKVPPHPARAAVEVARLPKDGLVEIDAIAVRPPSTK